MISPTTLVLKDPKSQLSAYSFSTGTFFLYDPTTETYPIFPAIPNVRGEAWGVNICREVTNTLWSYGSYSHDHLGIYVASGVDAQRVNEMFVILKKMLNLNTDEKVIVHEVDTSSFRAADGIKRAVILKLPPFWMANGLRRCMLTLFLRCAACYYKGDLEAAFKQYSLLMMIKPAVDLFLSGRVWPTISYTTNMVIVLKDKTPAQLNELLRAEQVEIAPVAPPVVLAPVTPMGAPVFLNGFGYLTQAQAPAPVALGETVGLVARGSY